MFWVVIGVYFLILNEVMGLFKFLMGWGWIGWCFVLCFWEIDGSLGCENLLCLIVGKKWYVVKWLIYVICSYIDILVVDYLFNESDVYLFDLGGVEIMVEKC